MIDENNDKLFEIPLIVVNEKPDSCKIQEVINQEIHRSFQLDTSPLFRIKLFSLGANNFILTIVFHHIITDFNSKEIFSKELSSLYNSIVTGTLPLIENPSGQYSDFSRWQQKWLEMDDAKKMLTEWENEIVKPLEIIKLPSDFITNNNISFEGKRKHFIMDIDISKKIRVFSKKHSINTFTLLLTLYSIFLNRLTSHSDIIIGVPFTNRRIEKFKKTFGCFMNILPLQVNITSSSSLTNLLEQVRKKMLKAHRKQETPFVLLNSVLGRRDGNTIFRVGYTFEPPMQLTLSGLVVTPVIIETEWSSIGFFPHYLGTGELFSCLLGISLSPV